MVFVDVGPASTVNQEQPSWPTPLRSVRKEGETQLFLLVSPPVGLPPWWHFLILRWLPSHQPDFATFPNYWHSQVGKHICWSLSSRSNFALSLHSLWNRQTSYPEPRLTFTWDTMRSCYCLTECGQTQGVLVCKPSAHRILQLGARAWNRLSFFDTAQGPFKKN